MARDIIGFGSTLLREAMLAVGMIGLLYAGLFAHTGLAVPLVVVESSSMVHEDGGEIGSIDAGDLVLVHDGGYAEITTYAEATRPGDHRFGHESHGMAGDVIIYQKNGVEGTPIIHRALLRVVAQDTRTPDDRTAEDCGGNGTWDANSVDSDGQAGTCVLTWTALGTNQYGVNNISWSFDGIGTGLYECPANFHREEEFLVIRDWTPAKAGILTLGDNNGCSIDQGKAVDPYSQGLGHVNDLGMQSFGVDIVSEDHLVGVAGGEIPWLGTVKLMLSGDNPGTTHVPSSSWTGLIISVAFLLAAPFVLEPMAALILTRTPEEIEAEREKVVTEVGAKAFEEE